MSSTVSPGRGALQFGDLERGPRSDLCPEGGLRAQPLWARHFVPGYYQLFPPGQKPFSHRSATELS